MTTVVIASNREDSMRRWLEAWRENLWDSRVILVEDSKVKTFDLDTSGYSAFEHYAWDDIDRDLGNNSWIVPRRTSAIKSYGFLKARGDRTWTLDDDCFPEPARGHGYLNIMNRVFEATGYDDPWFNTMRYTGLYPRGYPYDIRHEKYTAVHHGLWSNIPDLDGVTALENPSFRAISTHTVEYVPYGKLFPMCGMNLAFETYMLPAMYFMLQGHERVRAYDQPINRIGLTKLPFDRFDDIWAGLFVKRITDHLGYAVTTGAPSIVHTKESDPQMRVEKEAPGIEVHEKLWRHVAEASLTGCKSVSDCYDRLAGAVDSFACVDPDNKYYWYKLGRAMRIWTELAA
jgi:hypothetical protein